MGNEHEFGEIQDLGVQFKVACDSLVDSGAPVLRLHHFSCVETESVSPKMRHMPNLNLEIADTARVSFNEVRIFNKLEEELVEVRRNVDALEPRVVVLVD